MKEFKRRRSVRRGRRICKAKVKRVQRVIDNRGKKGVYMNLSYGRCELNKYVSKLNHCKTIAGVGHRFSPVLKA